MARYALIEAFALAGVRRGSRILLPEYICRDVLACLHQLGALPCWFPVDTDLTPATPPSDWPKADVVLAVNYFGFPQDLRPFHSFAQRTGAVVIEDNAHGYLSRDENGQWLGCRTSIGIFSLRKTLRIPDGAALWVSKTHAIESLKVQSAFKGAGIHPAQLVKARLRGLPVMGELAYKLSTRLARAFRKRRTGSYTPMSDPASEHNLPLPANPWVGLLKAVALFEEPKEIMRRRMAFAQCAEFGDSVGAAPVFSILPIHCAPYAYAFRGDSAVFDEMQIYATRQGFDLVSWPDLPTEIFQKAPKHYRNVFLVNFLW